ncbi:unnamed protein product [Tenebrio molitor]|nr:unnamed protein product [Tenebrio molitor]
MINRLVPKETVMMLHTNLSLLIEFGETNSFLFSAQFDNIICTSLSFWSHQNHNTHYLPQRHSGIFPFRSRGTN